MLIFNGIENDLTLQNYDCRYLIVVRVDSTFLLVSMHVFQSVSTDRMFGETGAGVHWNSKIQFVTVRTLMRIQLQWDRTAEPATSFPSRSLPIPACRLWVMVFAGLMMISSIAIFYFFPWWFIVTTSIDTTKIIICIQNYAYIGAKI